MISIAEHLVQKHQRCPSKWLLLTLHGSCGQNQSALEQIEARSPIALAFNELQPIDLAFGLPAAPVIGQGRPDRGAVAVQPRGEGRDGGGGQASAFLIQSSNFTRALRPAGAVLPTPEARQVGDGVRGRVLLDTRPRQ